MANTDTARRLGLLAVAAGLAVAIGAVVKRRAAQDAPARSETYVCECGAAYRVHGVDRHRVYWREGASNGEAVLGDRCVECDAPLPSGHDVATV